MRVALHVFVDEDQREALRVDARTSIAERFKDKVGGVLLVES